MWLRSLLLLAVAHSITSENTSTTLPPELDWWQTAVFYQIYPRSFMDSNDDGIGDLPGITSKLSHLSDMNVKATWLSPIFESPMVDFGYDISNFTAIHGEYGTMEDFEKLMAKAKELDVKLILDFVPNHTSNKCEWFIKSTNRVPGYEDYYVWADPVLDKDGTRKPPNNWPSVFYGSAWTWSPERGQYYLHQFTAEQPDLNYRNPAVMTAMEDVLLFWLDKGVSGFRVDAVPHLFEDPDLRDEPETGVEKDPNAYDFTRHIYTKDLPEVYDLVYRWRELLDKYAEKHGGGTRVMMTEAYTDLPNLMKYYESEDGRKGAHIPFNFLMITDLSGTSDAREFVLIFHKWMTYMPRGGTANWVLGNHDQPRVTSRFGKDRVDAMNILLMTLPGVGVTYYGEEIGMEDNNDISWEETEDPAGLNVGPVKYKEFSRDPERTPFQWDSTKNAGFSNADKTWLPVPSNYKTLNRAAQVESRRSHFKQYQKLTKLRQMPTLQKGSFFPMALGQRIFAFKRELKGHPTIITVINVSPLDVAVDLRPLGDFPDELKVLITGVSSPYEEGNRITVRSINMSPYESLVLIVPPSRTVERRELIKTIIGYGNIILIGMLMYKLWNNKWTKLSFNKLP